MDVDPNDTAISSEEADLLTRSTKKQKASALDFCPQRPLRSYKDSLTKPVNDWDDHLLHNLRISEEDIDSDQDDNSDNASPQILLSREDK